MEKRHKKTSVLPDVFCAVSAAEQGKKLFFPKAEEKTGDVLPVQGAMNGLRG